VTFLLDKDNKGNAKIKIVEALRADFYYGQMGGG
jgi:hypothetical protein